MEEEIHSALMDMRGNKAPGPDGFTVAFWQFCWEFVKEEVLEMFKEFHEQNAFLKSLNNTFLVLIPKRGGTEELGDFRPISLLGGLYKLLAKILDASLIANEFLMRVMQKMGFGAKWRDWIWSCISTAKFLVLVNGEPAGFFSSSKGLQQGDPISPYLFVMGMEVLSALIRRAVEGGCISGCRIWRGRGQAVNISHLLFADDAIVFCEARKDNMTYLSWILCWFEAVSGLRINLAKSEIIPVGEVEGILEMAVELGCKVGQLPSTYLGLPWGVPNKALDSGKKARKVAKRFLVGGGSTERKAHLVNWERVCVGKEEGGLGLRKLAPLNKALLGKWVWRFAWAKDEMWKRVLVAKYGQEEFGWEKAPEIRFWEDPWCGDVELSRRFPQLFTAAAQRNATVGDMWDQNSGQGGWNLRSQKITLEEDSALWKGGKKGKFGVKEVYGLPISPSVPTFPKKGIWVENVPSKLAFFAWEATWGRVLTLDRLQKRGWQLPNCCFLCGSDEENVNHLLIHCTVARVLWRIVLSLFGAQWVFPEFVKEVVLSWKESYCDSVGLDCEASPCLVLMVWEKCYMNMAIGTKIRSEKAPKSGFGRTLGVGRWSWLVDSLNSSLWLPKGSATVGELWDHNSDLGSWNLRFSRGFNDWELNMVGIWVENVPSKLAFFAWEATWGRILTLDRLQKRGWQLPNCCYLCGMDEENVNHLLLHCTVARVLWGIVLGLVGANGSSQKL
ncbi:putative mitochondrial protein [Vitis vinifera]|uniref:Putative mitochondrial protein n=1 Tax=Vitis vinifera TaxID=29760 RepID=A0A438D7K5_VITVI|nr:putative mitochondrial protein [Vitis vinifera]